MQRAEMEALVGVGGEEIQFEGRSVIAMAPEDLESLQDALKELLSATRWRKTEEELPKEGKRFLFAVLDYGNRCYEIGHVDAGWYRSDNGDRICRITGPEKNNMKVTHWLPIPEVESEAS